MYKKLLIVSLIVFFTGLTLYLLKPQPPDFNFPSLKISPSLIPKIEQKVSEKINILFAGDFMFDRHIRKYASENSNDFILENVKEVLLDNDLVVVNLEGPITDNPSRSLGSIPGSSNNYYFTFDKSVAKTLIDHNINLVSLGNNHILNFGEDGLLQTKKYLENSNVNYFGDTGSEFISKILEIKNIKILFINYNQFVDGSEARVLQEIENNKNQVDLVILYTHWGNEYQTVANEVIVQQAHKFVDAGTDLIIGSHPHVVQQSEIYKNKKIYYSLGNFVFDQYFEENVKNGLMVKIAIDTEDLTLSFKDIKINMQSNGQTLVAD